MVDLVLGFLGKASPQLPVLFLGLSVKSMVGLSLLGLSLRYWPAIFDRYFTAAVHSGERLLQLAR
jgi:flagellar biosynthetic protein FliR